MVDWFSRNYRIKGFFLSIIVGILFVILIVSGFYPRSAMAQFFPYFPFGFRPVAGFQPFPNYSFFTPYSNLLIPNYGINPTLPIASTLGAIIPFPNPVATIAGATTIYVPPSATGLKVVVKPGTGIPSIKLSSVIAPLTVYVYPSGYIPPALVPVVTPTAPVTAIPAITPVTTVTPPATTLPAAVSGAFWRIPFFPPIF